MSKIHVTAKRDFLESLASSEPVAALAELVWNGFDAQSDNVQVIFDLNKLSSIDSIRVVDGGYGIKHPEIKSYFGNLGDSWKKDKVREGGRSLHGKNGKGRFKAFALGTLVEWKTTYNLNGKTYSYSISGTTSTLDDFDVSEPIEKKNGKPGTEVIISNIKDRLDFLLLDSPPQQMARHFAAYLTEYPSLALKYNGVRINPTDVQNLHQNYNLGDVEVSKGRRTPVSVSVIEWKIPTDRIIHLCDSKGVSLQELQAGQQIRAPGFNFSAYVKTDLFRELDKENLLLMDEMHPDVTAILKVSKDKVKEHFRRRTLEGQSQVVERWKKEEIYPYADKKTVDPVEEVERQVFDILAVNVQSYLPSFENADLKSRKFTFLLLAQAIRENPESVQDIITNVLGLKKEEQDDLAELLKKTPLSSIISSAKVVANRLDFLVGLETLLFDKKNKKHLLERDQLHKILENEAWLFHEGFALAGSEQRLEEVLKKHINELGKREDDPEPVKLPDGKTGRVDLMLHKAVQPRDGEFDYLIVELKRPLKKIDSDVLTQVEKYAMAVASDERFHGIPAKWTFIAISNELDDFAKRKSNQRGKPKSQVYDDADKNITVWAKTWAEVINDARARLQFVNKQLAYGADQDSAKGYLKKTYKKFIPNLEEPDADSEKEADGQVP
ncbi:MAG TPA: ATP-binding protein [Lentisphaeria bacterium]|nr:ATP-binding protein [Lentisphaeria bacterium]